MKGRAGRLTVIGSPETVVSKDLSSKKAVPVHLRLVDRTAQHAGAARSQVP